MQRDPMTIGLVVMLPLMQLFLDSGFAINTNPHDLPTCVLSADYSQYERTLTVACRRTPAISASARSPRNNRRMRR